MTKSVIRLDDKYEQAAGRVFISSNQALVRLPLEQARRDRAAGLRTAGYISGYRGSPLGVYDAALWAASGFLNQHNITFAPGLNEELAATAIRGTQELAWFGKSPLEGVFGLWYGKGLGLDRASEALKLANLEGAAAKGGVLVVVGDDHGGKSSASAHQSDQALVAGFMPILYPATTAEILEFGLFGWAMSRFTGLYVAMKCVTDTLDLTASIELPDAHRPFVFPDLLMPPEGLNIRKDIGPLVQEDWLVNKRLPAAGAFARSNTIDRVIVDSPRRTLAIVASGKAYLDLRQALADLGLSRDRCAALGIRVYKPGLIWPLEREGALAFARGHKALLVVEEKRPLIEDQLARLLYDEPPDTRPMILGKSDQRGAALLASTGELNAMAVRRAVRMAMTQLGLADEELEQRYQALHSVEKSALSFRAKHNRPAFYCSGCPHNTSTKIPEGSIAISAVGCHGLAAMVMPERRTMMPMQMGGDGMPWVSVGPWVDRQHVFQNMGDGTYSHSGVLAIRAAVAANANMTFKILYNDAVAMTGGQPVEMKLSPVDVVNQLVAENVKPVFLVSDDPTKYDGVGLPGGVKVRHRDDMEPLQRTLREIPGVSAIVYEQTCATEKRRRRKRGAFPDPDKRVFINPDVCEGCGDCSVQSNCVSIVPLETEFGQKRAIDQSSCNKDFSCTKGFCPSFLTVEGAKVSRPRLKDAHAVDALISKLPLPDVATISEEGHNILVAGIGGTGVLTVGALLGMAAHLEGKGCTVLDLTGMAQKGGSVTSHIRTARAPEQIFTARLGVGMADVILACDLVVATGPDVLKTIRSGETAAIANLDITPTGDFQTSRQFSLDGSELKQSLHEALSGGALHGFHATGLATDLVGDSIATNMLMVGYAAQKGVLPVCIQSLEEAIRLNGAFVESNLRTFALGRLAAHDPEALLGAVEPGPQVARLETLEALIESRVCLLTAYQDAHYAERYLNFVREIEAAVRSIEGHEPFVREVALNLARLMAYKDEYEVARLHTRPEALRRIARQFDGNLKLTFHLAPPMLPGRDANGRPKKREFGGWMWPIMGMLARAKALRGTPFDVFGYTEERKMERALIDEYSVLAANIASKLDRACLDMGVSVVAAASEIRGFGPVKQAAVARYRNRVVELMGQFEVAQASLHSKFATASPD
jgi:indolepyruvate ferredoxin oxidoreductase